MNTLISEQRGRATPPAIQVKDDTATTVSVASVSDQDWYVSRTHGIYHIPACPKGEPYALLLITSRSDALDLGDNRRFPFSISAREIADDLLQDLHDHGIFVCGGARPAAEELDQARTRRDSFYHRLVLDADTMWARGHSFREISDMHRRAAIALGIEREWAYVPTRMADCPACGEKVKHGVAVCRHCGAILDEEKAAKHGLGKGRSELEKPVIVKSDAAHRIGPRRPAAQGASGSSDSGDQPGNNSRK